MKIVLHGYGRMGRAVERIATERGHEIVATVDRTWPSDRRLPEGSGVLIDFSTAPAVAHAVDLACQAKVALVIGTTGWDESMGAVRARIDAEGIGAVYASNFSPGANAMFVLARHAASLLARFPDYAAGIEERHHAQKKDAPSGTALRIANAVDEGSGGVLKPPIASSRVGREFGLHTLFFDSPDDLIEISHRARGREGFARGAVIAAERIVGRRGLLRFEDLFFESP